MYPIRVTLQPPIAGSSKPSAVVALISDRAGNILAVSRKGNEEDLGLPGGKIEEGEKPEVALSREVREEVGLRIDPPEFVFIYERIDPASGHVAWCYSVTLGQLREQPRAVEAHTWVGWVKPERLLEKTCLFREYNLGLFQHLGWVDNDLKLWSDIDLLNEHTRLTREGFNSLNPIGRSDGYLQQARRNESVREELVRRLLAKGST